jgi:hypothetical protein
MNKPHTYFLQTLFQSCKQMGIVETQYDFSNLCGRRTTWFSASKSRNRAISSHAAITLSAKLKRFADEAAPKKNKAAIRKLSDSLSLYVTERALLDSEQ